MHPNGETITVGHLPNAHTDGDSYVYFKNANVIHAGDTFFNGFYPFIDVEHGGTLRGVIKAADTLLSLANDSTKIIPGHGPPGHGPMGDKAALLAYRTMLSQVHGLIADSQAQRPDGKTGGRF
ncbi:MAG: hypothetical protein HOI95_14140 [Chromatiales bacterium]|nr:hypothetical protein [Chromatiales bacterium]